MQIRDLLYKDCSGYHAENGPEGSKCGIRESSYKAGQYQTARTGPAVGVLVRSVQSPTGFEGPVQQALLTDWTGGAREGGSQGGLLGLWPE